MKTISVVTPCYNEEANVTEVYERVKSTLEPLVQFRYEHIFIDNASRDNTLGVLRLLAGQDQRVKVIVNTRNFGHLRSPMHAMFQATGDAVILLFSDLQDPPELLGQMIQLWENGTPVVLAIKETSDENGVMFWLRSKYYRLVTRLANLETYENFTGFGLYDRRLIEIVRSFDDPYPYFRGMIAEVGLPYAKLVYNQKRRLRGITKNNFYTLYDLAMLGITNFSKVPLRILNVHGFHLRVIKHFVRIGLFHLQADVLESVFRWHRTAGDRDFLFWLSAALVYRHFGRIHRRHPYAGH